MSVYSAKVVDDVKAAPQSGEHVSLIDSVALAVKAQCALRNRLSRRCQKDDDWMKVYTDTDRVEWLRQLTKAGELAQLSVPERLQTETLKCCKAALELSPATPEVSLPEKKPAVEKEAVEEELTEEPAVCTESERPSGTEHTAVVPEADSEFDVSSEDEALTEGKDMPGMSEMPRATRRMVIVPELKCTAVAEA